MKKADAVTSADVGNKVNEVAHAEIIANYQELDNNAKYIIQETEIGKFQRVIARSIRLHSGCVYNGQRLTYEDCINANYYMCLTHLDLWTAAERLNNRKYAKRYRCKRRMKQMFGNALSKSIPLYFVTLTFNDSAFERTSAQTRHKYVTRILKNCGAVDYMANIDFGAISGREHYHAVVSGKPNLKDWEDSLGFVYIEEIKFGDNISSDGVSKNYLQLSKYINKFSNHANKESVGYDRAINARGVNYGKKWLYDNLEEFILSILRKEN